MRIDSSSLLNAPSPNDHPFAAQLPDRIELIGMLGAGGFGSVWRARDRVLNREVALKLLNARPRGLDDAERNADDALLREGRALAAVVDPHVVAVLDLLTVGDSTMLMMEYVPGGTLGAQLDRHGVIPRGLALHWISGIAAGLAAVHDAGLLHRDLKPDNVLVGADGRARLTDFGLATFSNNEAGSSGGSLGYAAPEVMTGGAASPASDLYSFGVVAWELLAGRRAFRDARTLQVLHTQLSDALPRTADVAPDIPAPVRDLIDRCLASRPERRPASARFVAESLSTWRESARDGTARGVRGAAVTIGLPVTAIAMLVLTAVSTWIAPNLSDAAGRAFAWENQSRTSLRFGLRGIEALVLTVAGLMVFISSVAHASRRLFGVIEQLGGRGAFYREVLRAPNWWPAWYPGESSAVYSTLPSDVKVLRVSIWIALPTFTLVAALMTILALAPTPVIPALWARIAIGFWLTAILLCAIELINLVNRYGSSPIYDVFELVAVMLFRAPVGDVRRALPAPPKEDDGLSALVKSPLVRRAGIALAIAIVVSAVAYAARNRALWRSLLD